MSDLWSHDVSPAVRATAAAAALGPEVFGAWCADVLTGAVGLDRLIAEPEPDPRWLADGAWSSWGPPETWAERGMAYWPRVWAARSLLHQWYPPAEMAVGAGLADEHWRVREMSARVAARHELGLCADACAKIIRADDNVRVRTAALQALAAVGEAEHAPVVVAAINEPEPKISDAARTTLTRMAGRLDRPVDSMLDDQ